MADLPDTGKYTRSILAVLVVLNLMGLTIWLAVTKPDSDQFTLLLGILSGAVTAILGFYFGATASSDRKDASQARMVEKLAEAAAMPADPPKFTWYSLMSDEERAKLHEAAKIDGRVATFINTSQVGRATEQDLQYLVTAEILTPERAKNLLSANKPAPPT